MRKIILFIAVVLIISCNQKATDESYELPVLKTQEDHQAFLQELFEKDQKYRVAKNKLDRQSSNSSKVEQQVSDSIAIYDELNLLKVRAYLSNQPYPSLKTYGDENAIAPIMVIHHQPSYTNSRQEFFTVFYKAYQNGDITPNMFSFYLGRWYENKHGEYYRMKSPYMIEDQIDTLIKELGLEIPE